MRNVADITKVIEKIIHDSPKFADFTVLRSGVIPDDNPSSCPWIGIYRREASYDPRSIGYATVSTDTQNWTGQIRLAIVILRTSLNNMQGPAYAEDELEEDIKNLLELFFSDITLKQSIDLIREVSITYTFDEYDSEKMHVQGAIVDLLLEVIQS